METDIGEKYKNLEKSGSSNVTMIRWRHIIAKERFITLRTSNCRCSSSSIRLRSLSLMTRSPAAPAPGAAPNCAAVEKSRIAVVSLAAGLAKA